MNPWHTLQLYAYASLPTGSNIAHHRALPSYFIPHRHHTCHALIDFDPLFSIHRRSEQQRAWLETELFNHPIRSFQTPEDWLLWRTKVSEGMSESEGWEWVQREAILKQGHIMNHEEQQTVNEGYRLDYGYQPGEPQSPLLVWRAV